MKSMIKSKKGFQLTDIPMLTIVLVVIALIMGIGAQILGNMQSANTMTGSSTETYENATFTALDEAVDFTPSSLLYDGAEYSHIVAASCTDVVLYNYSTTILTDRFTVSGCSATLTNTTFNDTEFGANFTYTYTTYNVNYNITQQGIEGQQDFSGWQGTWIVIIAAAVILGIIGKYLLRPV